MIHFQDLGFALVKNIAVMRLKVMLKQEKRRFHKNLFTRTCAFI